MMETSAAPTVIDAPAGVNHNFHVSIIFEDGLWVASSDGELAQFSTGVYQMATIYDCIEKTISAIEASYVVKLANCVIVMMGDRRAADVSVYTKFLKDKLWDQSEEKALEANEWFSGLMLQRIKENIERGGWTNCDHAYLIGNCRSNVNNVERLLEEGCDPEQLKRECADAANYLMMIADNIDQHPEDGP